MSEGTESITKESKPVPRFTELKADPDLYKEFYDSTKQRFCNEHIDFYDAIVKYK